MIMSDERIPDYLFVYGILQRRGYAAATIANAVKVRKAYGNMHVCLESYEHGEVNGSLLPVKDREHLAYLDTIEGPGIQAHQYRLVCRRARPDLLVQGHASQRRYIYWEEQPCLCECSRRSE